MRITERKSDAFVPQVPAPPHALGAILGSPGVAWALRMCQPLSFLTTSRRGRVFRAAGVYIPAYSPGVVEETTPQQHTWPNQ